MSKVTNLADWKRKKKSHFDDGLMFNLLDKMNEDLEALVESIKKPMPTPDFIIGPPEDPEDSRQK